MLKNKGKVKKAFLEALEITGKVVLAANYVDTAPRTLYRWKDASPKFAEDWDHVLLTRKMTRLENVDTALYKAAIDGSYNDRRLYYQREDDWVEPSGPAIHIHNDGGRNLNDLTDDELLKMGGYDTDKQEGGPKEEEEPEVT